MKQHYILTLVFFLSLAHLNAQSFINGSFENTTSTGCDYNISNSVFHSKMPNVFAFGSSNEVDIVRQACYITSIPDGDVAIALAANDAVAMELSAPLVSGDSYKITFKAFGNISFNASLNNLSIGSSMSNNAPGTVIYTAYPTADVWSDFSFDFVAPNTGSFITISGSNAGGWTNIDNFVITTSTLSTKDHEYDHTVTVYPNPSREFIKISGLTSKEGFKIYNILSAEVKSGVIANQEQIDISNFTNGLYFLKFENGNTIKFIKE